MTRPLYHQLPNVKFMWCNQLKLCNAKTKYWLFFGFYSSYDFMQRKEERCSFSIFLYVLLVAFWKDISNTHSIPTWNKKNMADVTEHQSCVINSFVCTWHLVVVSCLLCLFHQVQAPFPPLCCDMYSTVMQSLCLQAWVCALFQLWTETGALNDKAGHEWCIFMYS